MAKTVSDTRVLQATSQPNMLVSRQIREIGLESLKIMTYILVVKLISALTAGVAIMFVLSFCLMFVSV